MFPVFLIKGSLGRFLFLLSMWSVHGLSSITAFEGNWSIFEQQRYNWDNSAPFSFSDFHKPSVSYHFFFFFPDPHQVILIRAPPNDSVVWLPCPFQTVGWSYHTIVATLRTHLGGNAPSVSRVGSNQTRELTVTISRMKMLFASGELCPLLPVTLSCCSPDRERVKTELNTGGS